MAPIGGQGEKRPEERGWNEDQDGSNIRYLNIY
jgi:hypothetical protein